MKLKFCGAAQSVTGSRHLLDINGLKILLDCGLFQGGKKEEARELNERFLFNPSEVGVVLLSHAHIDHCGVLPRLLKFGFKGKIYSTGATRELAETMLLDAAHIQAQDAKFAEKDLGQKVEPLFSENDVRAIMKSFITFEYRQKFKLAENIWVSFYDAGHVLGSAITVIDFKDNDDGEQRRLVFTGDLGRKYMPILNDPYQVECADILITESTYASHVHDAIAAIRDNLAAVVNDVYKRRGKIIIPGFSFERTQELVYVLHELYNEKKIPAMPIFVDSPLSAEISEIFDRHRDYYDDETFRDFLNKKQSPFYFSGVKYLKSVEESKTLNMSKEPCIIISASGMCESGRIRHHLKYNMSDPKNLILVVGFMAEGTTGRKIVEGERKIKIFGELVPLRAEVVVANAFSAHADKIELLENIKHIRDLKNIFIVHGEERECEVLRDNIFNILKLKCRVDVVDLGEEFTVTAAGTASQLGVRREMYLSKMQKN